MEIDAHWLQGARRVESPNANARPEGEISAVVLHGISLPPGEFGGDAIEQLFTNTLAPDAHPSFAAIATLRVSAHLLIRRSGECVQFVAFDRRAWHAGRSRWRDGGRLRRGLNDFSVGIELEGTDDMPYAAAQYATLAKVLSALIAHYPALTRERVTGHAWISPGRKSDPGPAFDWAYLYRRLDEG